MVASHETKAAVKQILLDLTPFLDEKQRRILYGSAASALGHGGIKYVNEVTGSARNTITSGMEDIMTFEKVKEIIVETVNCDADSVVLEAKLGDDLGIDSLDAMEINMALEEAFAISIADEDIVKFVCVKDIVSYIDSKVEA